MTQETRNTFYWTAGITAVVAVVVLALWFGGVLEFPTAVQ